jgi:hypothetical protein
MYWLSRRSGSEVKEIVEQIQMESREGMGVLTSESGVDNPSNSACREEGKGPPQSAPLCACSGVRIDMAGTSTPAGQKRARRGPQDLR